MISQAASLALGPFDSAYLMAAGVSADAYAKLVADGVVREPPGVAQSTDGQPGAKRNTSRKRGKA